MTLDGRRLSVLVEAFSTSRCACPTSEAVQFRTVLTEHDGFREQMEPQLDPITDIFRTMHVTAFGLHRLEATAPWGVKQENQADEKATPSGKRTSPTDLAHFAMLSRGNCWLSVEGIAEPIPLTGGDCFLLAKGTSMFCATAREHGRSGASARSGPRPTEMLLIMEVVAHQRQSSVGPSVRSRQPEPITQLLPNFILIKADQKSTLALHNAMQALASEMAEQAPGSEVVASRLAEVLFIQVLRTHIASGPERNKGWLRAVFDPQMGTAPECHSRQSEFTLDGRIPGRNSGHVSLSIRSTF